MSVVPLPELKKQLHIEHNLDDDLLTHKLDAAEGYVSSYIGKELPDPCPAAITQAVLMLAAFWYGVREAATIGGNAYAVPFGVHDLLQAHREWAV